MKTLYLDCGMGAAGDMLAAALAELLPDPAAFVRELNALGIPGVTAELEPAVKCGITGSHLRVLVHGKEEESHDHHGHDHALSHPHSHTEEPVHDHDHDHPHGHEHSHTHSSMADIAHLVEHHLPLSDKVKADVMAVYALIAEAESHAHGVPVSQVHFHEVGAMDAVADITAVCLLMEKLAVDEVVVSPIHVGSGQVRCAHGVLPVPAPATAHILRGAPIYGGSIQGELCTPTGAALLMHFASRFGDMSAMCLQAVGYGMGKKDFPAANCVRAMLGETAGDSDTVAELACNVDDMTGEALGFAMEQLLAAGALDVFTSPIGMKKSRPATLLRLLCRPEDRERMAALLFRHTTTLGVRESLCRRYVLERSEDTRETPWGSVRVKSASGYGVHRRKYEYEDLADIARRTGRSLTDIAAELDS